MFWPIVTSRLVTVFPWRYKKIDKQKYCTEHDFTKPAQTQERCIQAHWMKQDKRMKQSLIHLPGLGPISTLSTTSFRFASAKFCLVILSVSKSLTTKDTALNFWDHLGSMLSHVWPDGFWVERSTCWDRLGSMAFAARQRTHCGEWILSLIQFAGFFALTSQKIYFWFGPTFVAWKDSNSMCVEKEIWVVAWSSSFSSSFLKLAISMWYSDLSATEKIGKPHVWSLFFFRDTIKINVSG